MTYSEVKQYIENGKTAMLPNFKGYFKWDYGKQSVYFVNGDFRCPIENLPITGRDDWYYII